jgi:hypothetical protein
MPEQCDNCKFYRVRTFETNSTYECRFSEPYMGGWPKVLATDWCGKWVTMPVEDEVTELERNWLKDPRPTPPTSRGIMEDQP